jgi:hypothetical protein
VQLLVLLVLLQLLVLLLVLVVHRWVVLQILGRRQRY